MAQRKHSPLSIRVRDLVNQPGEMREHTLEVPAPEKYGEAVAWVAQGTPMTIEARLEGLHEGILASAEVATTATAECVRCLDEHQFALQVDFQELFAYSSAEADSYTVVDDTLDLESIIRDTVVLDLPFQPVCKPECYGLDPETGEKRTGLEPDQASAGGDPRWRELEKLLEPGESQAP